LRELESSIHVPFSSSDAAGAVVHAAEIVDLASIYDPGVMLAIARVPPSAGALRHAERLLDAGLRRSLEEVDTPEGVPARGALERLSVLDGPHAAAWMAYLEEVITIFAYLLRTRTVGVRLMVSDAPHCPRLHVDRVFARAVLTVVGAGTEWFADESLDRRRLGHAGGSDDATSGVVRDWGHLRTIEPGHLAVFKGTAWPGAEERAIVHRSPPADGDRRVVLTFDWLE